MLQYCFYRKINRVKCIYIQTDLINGPNVRKNQTTYDGFRKAIPVKLNGIMVIEYSYGQQELLGTFRNYNNLKYYKRSDY